MASRTDSRAGQSLQDMITCVEEVLHLAGPAKDQLRGLQPYISQLLSQQNDARKHNYDALLAENAQLKNDLLALKSSDDESIEKVFAEMQQKIMRGKDEILRINAARLQAIQEENKQMRSQLEEMKSTNKTLSSQIKSLQNERDELEKSFSDQHDRNSSLEVECSQMQTQLQYMTSANETLSSQLQSLQKERDFFRKHEAERQTLHSELEKIKKENEQQNKQLQEVLKETKTLEELVASQKRQLSTSNGHSDEEYEAVVKKNEQLQRDLLASQSRHQPAHQELTFTEECNPEHIAELYKNLYRNIWPDAFIEGTKFFSLKSDYNVSQQIINVLKGIYLTCKEECARQRVRLEKAFSLDSENKLLPEYKQLITQVRCKTTQLVMDTIFKKTYTTTNKVKRFAERILPFVQESIRICWLMNLHDPPLACIQTELWAYGSPFDGNMYECYKCVGDKIDFIVWPALVMSETGQILAKGVVKCVTTMK